MWRANSHVQFSAILSSLRDVREGRVITASGIALRSVAVRSKVVSDVRPINAVLSMYIKGLLLSWSVVN